MDCTEKKYYFKFNSPDMVQFKCYMLVDDKKNAAYDSIVEGQFIEVDGFGRFIISDATVCSKGKKFEYKDCKAMSIEVLLAQKHLELFTINMGTTESIDGVKFYNLADPGRSLLTLALEKCPDWEIGHVDPSLMTMERCFEITRQDIYSFLTKDVAAAFQCVFLFDSLHRRINVYAEENIGDDTDVYVTYDNLLKNTEMTSSIDDIKTCLTVTGADDLNLREVNMGYDKIYMLDYYHSLEFMSKGLYDAYSAWVKKWDDNIENYTALLSQYQNYYNQINEVTNKKMPSNPDSTNWEEYGLVPLQEKLAAFEQRQAVMIKAGQGDKGHKDYNSMYLPVFNAINAIKSQISVVEKQVADLKAQQDSIGKQMDAIIASIDMKKNFTMEQLKELGQFIREDELSSSNFVVTDVMTDSERMDMLKEMLKYGQKELAKVSQPQLQFRAEMLNLFEMEAFDKCSSDFEPGNFINIIIRDDYIIKARLLTIDMDFYHPEDFTVTFGNMNKVKGKSIYADITKAINAAKSAATTVSFNASSWNQANKDADNISKIISNGLLASGNYLRNGDDSELVIDKRGIFINTVSGEYAGKDSIFEGGGRILFTNDNWKTVSMSVGRADVTIKGKTESRFGTFADFVIAGYVGSSTIEGSEIYGGILQSLNYVAGKTGSKIDLNKGTFEFNANNETKLILDENGNLTVKGTVKAEKGWIGGQNAFIIEDGKIYCKKDSLTSNKDGVYIGTDGIALGANSVLKLASDGTFYAEKGYIGGTNGFVIDKNKLYNGKTSISDAANGIYLGTDGIALGMNEAFKVTPQGHATMKSGTIGGATIQSDSIKSSNGNWWINSNGQASFNDVYINNVRSGSSFGGVVFNGAGTYGGFGNGFWAGNSFGLDGGALNNFNDLVVRNITADYVYSKAIEAGFITADTISANYATIGSLNATNAEIQNLKSASISVDRLTAANVNGHSIGWNRVDIVKHIDTKVVEVVTHISDEGKVYKDDFSVITGYRYGWIYILGQEG